MHLSANLKTLRKYRGISQQRLAEDLRVKRSTLNAWENRISEPGVAILIRIADHFRISIDRLLRQDLTELTRFELKRIEEGFDVDLRGKYLRILATSVGQDGEERIEVVPEKAKAGYTAGYSDPEFVGQLPRISLPFLGTNKKYRMFPVKGDSMPPVDDGDWVIAEYIQDWNELKDGEAYIVVSRQEGIVFKKVYNNIKNEGELRLVSTNPEYPPYSIHIREVLELWKFKHYISGTLTNVEPQSNTIANALNHIVNEIDGLKAELKNYTEK